MSDSVSSGGPPTQPLLERWAHHIKAFTAIVLAIAALFGAIKALNTNWAELWKTWWPEVSKPVEPTPTLVAAQCLKVLSVEFPTEVRFGDWGNPIFKLKGRSDCADQSGLYVAFLAEGVNDPGVRLNVPFNDHLPGCQAKSPVTESRCWTKNKPISPGPFDWVVTPPTLSTLSGRPPEKVRFAWEVHELDSPPKPVLAVGERVVSIRNDP